MCKMVKEVRKRTGVGGTNMCNMVVNQRAAISLWLTGEIESQGLF